MSEQEVATVDSNWSHRFSQGPQKPLLRNLRQNLSPKFIRVVGLGFRNPGRDLIAVARVADPGAAVGFVIAGIGDPGVSSARFIMAAGITDAGYSFAIAKRA